MGREQKGGRSGVGEGKEGNACPQTLNPSLDFETPVRPRPRTGLLIGAAWLF